MLIAQVAHRKVLMTLLVHNLTPICFSLKKICGMETRCSASFEMGLLIPCWVLHGLKDRQTYCALHGLICKSEGDLSRMRLWSNCQLACVGEGGGDWHGCRWVRKWSSTQSWLCSTRQVQRFLPERADRWFHRTCPLCWYLRHCWRMALKMGSGLSFGNLLVKRNFRLSALEHCEWSWDIYICRCRIDFGVWRRRSRHERGQTW